MTHLTPTESFEEHFYNLLHQLGIDAVQKLLKEAGEDVSKKILNRLDDHSQKPRAQRGRRPLGKRKVVHLRHKLLTAIEEKEDLGEANYLDIPFEGDDQQEA